MAFYHAMYAHFGPQHWWPGDGPLEIMIGAVLTQNTNWGNVKRAIDRLRAEGLIDVEKLVRIDPTRLAELIQPAGYFRVKARRLQNLMRFVWEECRGDLDALFRRSTADLREALLGVNGIGRETADDIVLYAAGRPTFVVDAYTFRILLRHHHIGEDDDYETIKDHFESHLAADATLFNEYHALLVATGKHFCKKKPSCAGCPLEDFPHDPELPLSAY